MGLNISPSTSEELKQLFSETLLSKTTKINKISDNSVIGGVAYGIAKVANKAEKDIIQALGKLYPDTAFGTNLDSIAQEAGIAGRFGASQSSTYVRVVGDPGTVYVAGTNTFRSTDGIQFDLEESTTLGSFGFDYVKVRSVDSAAKTNVKPGTITSVTPTPTGHRFCVNEYIAIGGRDQEDDILFRQRIKDGANILSKGTIGAIEQAFMLINNNVLSVRYQGINSKGQLKLAIITQNGIALNSSEIGTLLTTSEDFFGLSELRPFGRRSYGVEIVNISVQPIDISFRCAIFAGVNIDDVRVSIQTRISKYLDFRTFQSGITSVDWVTLIEIVRNTSGMKYVPDTYFFPNVDVPTDPNSVVRLRSFMMLNLDGSVLNNLSGSFSPVFYPNNPDVSFQRTVLANI